MAFGSHPQTIYRLAGSLKPGLHELRIPIDSSVESVLFSIAVLGHELQHACESAATPEVTSQAALRQLFERIGDRTTWSGDRYETAAAVEIERRVVEEVRQVR